MKLLRMLDDDDWIIANESGQARVLKKKRRYYDRSVLDRSTGRKLEGVEVTDKGNYNSKIAHPFQKNFKVWIGTFDTPEEAHHAYLAMKRRFNYINAASSKNPANKPVEEAEKQTPPSPEPVHESRETSPPDSIVVDSTSPTSTTVPDPYDQLPGLELIREVLRKEDSISLTRNHITLDDWELGCFGMLQAYFVTNEKEADLLVALINEGRERLRRRGRRLDWDSPIYIFLNMSKTKDEGEFRRILAGLPNPLHFLP
ncbi:OLC1v1022801C1 [Oldenlandia corymbosa var. corymbosa]|uniref:OLC1v1022801C1 n=1 Tax=Oldenlandia corymbosa var. corymbosa TaxID=529605 RepID=A0AAV1C128_OLDCO|nr:OLC1v1022801C1 [Oldenlandia corymbosa var. corymbosa]